MRSEKELLELLEQAKEGDMSALNTLLSEVQPQLYRFSLNMCRHKEDAEDVLQDSMLNLARSFRDFRGASSLSTWLFTIARSVCIKKRRKRKHEPEYKESFEGLSEGDSNTLKSAIPNPHQALESTQLWQQIQSAIKLLEPDYREILVLRDIEGLSAKEVSEVVGISISATKSRLHRARAELRKNLTPKPYRPDPSCPDIRRVFSEHLEGDLSPSVCSTMEAHVAECPDCASECEGLKNALNACSSSENRVPEDIKARVQEALRLAWKEK